MSEATKFDCMSEVSGRVLVVDDDRVTRMIHRSWLSARFDVETASSGIEALEICKKHLPDLVLLDVVMPEMDGYETCRQLREFTDIPILFATANESLEEHLQAFDAGGDDIIIKPVAQEILLRKVSLAIYRKNEQLKLLNEKDSLHSMAMNFLSAVGETGVLQKFMQTSLTSATPKELGQHLVEAIQEYGLESIVLIRDDNTSTILASHGNPSEIETSILEKSISMGRIFQFKKRLAVNYDRVSVIVTNMPTDESEKSGRIRDNICTLVEMTEAMCENTYMRQAAISRAKKLQVALATAASAIEALDEKRIDAQVGLRLLLQELVDNIEKTYSWLGTTRDQERCISDTMYASVGKALSLLETTGDQYDAGFVKILAALRESHGD